MINYLEDYQLEDLRNAVGGEYPAGGPTGSGILKKVGKKCCVWESVVSRYCTDPYGEVGVIFQTPMRLSYNIIG